ncbi:hypothetical protein Tco_0331483 [Tanacetum coccineum]
MQTRIFRSLSSLCITPNRRFHGLKERCTSLFVSTSHPIKVALSTPPVCDNHTIFALLRRVLGLSVRLNNKRKDLFHFCAQFYKIVRIIRNLNGTSPIALVINNFEITLSLEEFARILKIPCQGVCVYTPEWPISSLQNGVDSNPDVYPHPHKDSSLIRDALFYERTQPKTRKMKGVDIILDPFQMIVSELKTDLKK